MLFNNRKLNSADYTVNK